MVKPAKSASSAYRQAGVDRDAASEAKERIARLARTTFTPGVANDIGLFGSAFRVTGFRDPVLVSHTDGVGTKLKIAVQMGRLDTVGEDLVHHCVNDILTCGARPLFFLDYMGFGHLTPSRAEAVVIGLTRACKALGVALIGGETAEMPGVYSTDDFDLVGFIVGAVESDQLLDGSRIQAGDALLGIPSSGLHTNGFSLVRRVFNTDADPSVLRKRFPELGGTLGEELLVPHRCYEPVLRPVMPVIKGMAHITGGGLLENTPRVLPKGLAARFDATSWQVPPIFRLIQREGAVADREMFRVFNMGIGMVLMIAEGDVPAVLRTVPDARLIGQVVPQQGDEHRVELLG
ncbi:MAG: phosphoribosylformylglycinamidine cyclo-ligase [Dehalococcoidia bacterium]|nr:phosphoribosylformylglycinamidine cyclo-ligase [Dehalococcoidia bacterium]